MTKPLRMVSIVIGCACACAGAAGGCCCSCWAAAGAQTPRTTSRPAKCLNTMMARPVVRLRSTDQRRIRGDTTALAQAHIQGFRFAAPYGDRRRVRTEPLLSHLDPMV